MKKILSLAILACSASLFAQGPTPKAVGNSNATTTQEIPTPCREAFDAVKNTYPRDAATDRIYAMVNARVVDVGHVDTTKLSNEYLKLHEANLRSCGLAVEVLKVQLSNVALRTSTDDLNKKNIAVQRDISNVKDSLIEMWTKDAQGAKSLNAALSDERNRLERLSRETAEKDSIEKARMAEELAKQQKALAEKDSLLALQKAEADKKLEALRSKTISVYKDARGTILSMSDILFMKGSADLTPGLKENLAEIAAILKNLLTESEVVVEGHTDNQGSEALNQSLSERRASAVLGYLVERGVDKNRLKSFGYGFSKPIADNATEEGRSKNRRVELVIKD